MSWLAPCQKDLLFSKNDPLDPRLGEKVEITDTHQLDWTHQLNDFCILGYPDDEGIGLNKGRLGAALGPNGIRNFLYRMTPSLFLPVDFKISDLGNLKTDLPLPERHERGQRLIYNLAKHNKNWVSLGGGHDYGYCDASGFIEANSHDKNHKPVIINFDAHLDVRSDSNGYNSGTPFFRVLEKWADQCHFFEIGIQAQCNSRHHYQYVLDHGGQVISNEQIFEEGLKNIIEKTFAQYPHNPCFISLDIDFFSSSDAAGCSQSWPTGISAHEFLTSFHWLVQNLDIRGLGIYEVSPPLDINSNTQRLAALIVYNFYHQLALKKITQRKSI